MYFDVHIIIVSYVMNTLEATALRYDDSGIFLHEL